MKLLNERNLELDTVATYDISEEFKPFLSAALQEVFEKNTATAAIKADHKLAKATTVYKNGSLEEVMPYLAEKLAGNVEALRENQEISGFLCRPILFKMTDKDVYVATTYVMPNSAI